MRQQPPALPHPSAPPTKDVALGHLHPIQAEQLERLKQHHHAGHSRRRPFGVKPAHMPTLTQGDRGQALSIHRHSPTLTVPLDLIEVVGVELPVHRGEGQSNRTMADSNSHFRLASQAAAENHLLLASEALAPDDLQQ